jgi:mRNA interferase RelE/StbE
VYRILLSRNAEKFLAGIQKKNRRLFTGIIRALDAISENPYCAKPLVGNLAGYYSYRVGDYRILFEIEKKDLLVYVEKIEHRARVYR